MSSFPVTERSKIRRMHERGSHEHAAVHAVLDAAPLCHVGYVIDGEPYVTPTIHWRKGNRVFWHGSAASRFLRKIEGQRVCLTVSLMDGYVLARSAYNHSVNFRSAMVFGRAQSLTDPDEIAAALRHLVDDVFPGRWDSLRPMSAQEQKATSVVWMDIEEASVKDRVAPPGDDDEADYPVWAGVLPMRTALGAAEPAPGPHHDLPLPEELARLIASGRLR
ncbi:pyridoxamine 5'-phosphate oxidase family protein [Novosphingobium sp. Fuku2-ISO-50]|uniref:pyridoxamine 5'-phosphate oxidase family protein n=1 Tax=Novosphingobium sp. Fuku2-ISO-50 TaxID=1739114 RepID=UPI00076D03D3|nr:pyridoxamine 5'-phosphate oxidase family protein [Novosphingobium sp. Fuku2-ISO-50]KUR80373.1 flavin-nucleotide-binding protein [Novosphingobium sp. Fuku2-ISO-50]